MELGLILVVLIPNSLIKVSILYFLHTIITLLAAFYLQVLKQNHHAVSSGCLSRQGHYEFSVFVIESSLSNLRYVPQLIL